MASDEYGVDNELYCMFAASLPQKKLGKKTRALARQVLYDCLGPVLQELAYTKRQPATDHLTKAAIEKLDAFRHALCDAAGLPPVPINGFEHVMGEKEAARFIARVEAG